ncbi:leukocyte elastase inhibitor isoform X1 [Hylaeus volcanicus]|uniref:leukocyte elastase inhibitor isoform X1 n=1 Tax=Hylaeus volcanicus TaxID=313075 RepID=UPI0023B87E31|nr:leukocyte elastase inhibitor isoform X1 [Hylaeus volcanicus]
MAFTLMFIGLLACGSAQLIYPDEFERIKTSTVPPTYFTTPSRQPRPSVERNVAYSQSNPLPPEPLSINVSEVMETSTTQRATQVDSKFTENPLLDWGDHVNNIIVRGVMKFALDIEREIYRTRGTSMIDQRENIVFSPISLSATMAMVLAGSAGRTFEEVSRVLGLEAGVDISRNSEIVHQMFGILLNQLRSKIAGSPGPRVDIATGAFVQEGYPILPQFKAISQNVYDTEVINVDFTRQGKLTQELINSWVKQKTMGKIATILSNPPNPATSVILLSALYFNGEWNQHFLPGATKRKPFFIEPNEAITIDMMYNGGPFPFYEDKQLGVKILGLPYKGYETTMYVLLPTAMGAKALQGFQNQLTVDIIENLIQNMKNETCIVGFPRMKLSSSLSLMSTLASLGLTSLFNPNTADLSLMSQGYRNNASPSPNTQNDVTFNPRFGNDKKPDHIVRRNYFTYEDKVRSYTVEQWSTGFSIRKSRKPRETESVRRSQEGRNSYEADGSVTEDVNVVNLEENKYRFQGRKRRTRRQSRPIDQNFLDFVKQRNLPSYGLDELRNSAALVNPHLYATDVLHKVEIDITEKGTEAAAATAVLLERDGNQKRLVANRPFLFFIRHDPTRLVLFWGTVNAPTPNYSVT